MFKNTIMAILVALITMASTVNAIPIDTGSEYLVFNDVDGNNDDIIVMNFSFTQMTVDPWDVGIYEFTTDTAGNATETARLSILSIGSTFPTASATFNLVAGTATNGTDTITVDETFGVYFIFGPNDDDISYTHSNLNFNGNDNFKVADVLGMTEYGGAHTLLTHELISIGINDASPAPVPEPATILLLGSGLLGLAGISRKKILKS